MSGKKDRYRTPTSSSYSRGSGDDVYETRPCGGTIIWDGSKRLGGATLNARPHHFPGVREGGRLKAGSDVIRIRGCVLALIGKVCGPLIGARGHTPWLFTLPVSGDPFWDQRKSFGPS